MLMVSVGKPKIYLEEAWNDMGAFFPTSYQVSGNWFYMELNDYMAKRDFENFDMKPNLPKEEVERLVQKLTSGEKVKIEYLDSPWGYRLQQLLSQSGGQQVWQFNAVNGKLDGYIRQVAVLGEPRLQLASWFDCRVKYPFLKIVANLLNKTLIFRRRKEIKKWENFRNGF